jgi:CheY-like chemotaxis protein
MKLEVLIVDDSDVVLFLHTEILAFSELAKSPITATDGKKALEFINQNQNKDTHSLVFLDINMPIMDGWEFLEEIQTREDVNNIHVVMVTSSINSFDKNKASKYKQVIGFFEKPITFEDCLKIKAEKSLDIFFSNS